MAVNLDKNRDKIIYAWKDVLDDKSSTDWALFGYEGQTNDLKVISHGDGGLDELRDDLNSGKIMYAFVRIHDVKTSLTKFLLINWQGEGAPTSRKGTCANHIRDVARLLTGAHLTINARTEDDVEPERIIEKISSVGSEYSFKEPRQAQEEHRGPIGTNYARVIPAKEINSEVRDSFWRKEEEEERQRVIVERERKQHELQRAEEERRRREEKEHMERERRIASELKPTSINIGTEKITPNPLSPVQTAPLSPVRSLTQAEEMRQQRNREAKELIGGRVGTAKAIFSQNTANGQMHSQKSSAPVKPVRYSIQQRINSLKSSQQMEERSPEKSTVILSKPVAETIIEANERETIFDEDIVGTRSSELIVGQNIIDSPEEIVEQDNITVVQQEPTTVVQQDANDTTSDDDQFSTIKRSPHTKTVTNNGYQASIENTEPVEQPVVELNRSPNDDNVTVEDIIYQDMLLSDGGLKARALYDYQAADASEITFDPGDIIQHIDRIDEGWWQGLAPNGSFGLFPANYVELIN